jgi:ornithine carbamoyltransferase
MAPRHFLRDDDLLKSEQQLVLSTALTLSQKRENYSKQLLGKGVGLYFEKPSLRTRVSSERACLLLGAHPVQLRGEEVQMKRGETATDTIRVLAGYLDLLLARVSSHSILEEFAETHTIPVVNGLSDTYHPLQSLADLLTFVQEWGANLAGRRLVYLGDGNNVARSLAIASQMQGMNFVLAGPKRYWLEQETEQVVANLSAQYGGSFTQTEESRAAVQGADALYTDVWASMGDELEAGDRMSRFASYQLNEQLLESAAPHAIVLHCLPAHRGEEISQIALEGPQSRVLRQAHNRMHATAALFLFLLEHVGVKQ